MPPPPPAVAHERLEEGAAHTPKPDVQTGEEQTSPTEPMYTSTTTSTRRNASGSVSSVFSGNKMRHLKKEDGIPLWRKDIQYDFLKLVFFDQTRCFTKYSDGSKNNTFAEIYIDAMAKSSKCSKILKEKLLQDTDGAVCMAMVCLLVNVGRMNTTLNCKVESATYRGIGC
jgi:Ino eighty subunit 1